MELSLLDNIAWHALTGAQAGFAAGSGASRRYARGFSPIVAFADIGTPDFAALDRYCAPDEHFYTGGWSGPVPRGWRVEEDSTMFQMVWQGTLPADASEATPPVRLVSVHAAQMLELVALTHPGPFGPRTVELGEYLGYFVDSRLVAMAGERMHAATLREISGVCTHPAYQGRGLARRLVHELLRRELRRDETPFLHVMRDNVSAQRVYERMGFRPHQELTVRVLARCAT